jgi:hypothetical protein
MFVSTREDERSGRIYDHARAAGHGKYRALRGLGARWVRILWRCWIDRTLYDPGRRQLTPGTQLTTTS